VFKGLMRLLSIHTGYAHGLFKIIYMFLLSNKKHFSFGLQTVSDETSNILTATVEYSTERDRFYLNY